MAQTFSGSNILRNTELPDSWTEDKGNIILWRVGIYWTNDVASHPRRIKFQQNDYEILTCLQRVKHRQRLIWKLWEYPAVCIKDSRQADTSFTVTNSSTCSSLGAHLLSLSDAKTIKP